MDRPNWFPPVPSWFPGLGLVARLQTAHQRQVRIQAAQLVQEQQRNRAARRGSAAAAAAPASVRAGLQLVPGYHWLVSGMPGVGKTTAAIAIVSRLQALWQCPAIYVDSKGGEFDSLAARGATFWRSQDPPPWPTGVEPNSQGRGSQGSGGSGQLQLVWTPEYDNVANYDTFLERLLKAGQPVILVVDELSSLGKNTGTSFPVNLQRLLKQGRAKGITLFVLTQELAYIPRQVLRMTTHLALFMQDPADPNDYDTRRVAALSGLPPVQRKYQFNYRNRMEPEKRWTYRNVQQFLGMGRPQPSLKRGRPQNA